MFCWIGQTVHYSSAILQRFDRSPRKLYCRNRTHRSRRQLPMHGCPALNIHAIRLVHRYLLPVDLECRTRQMHGSACTFQLSDNCKHNVIPLCVATMFTLWHAKLRSRPLPPPLPGHVRDLFRIRERLIASVITYVPHTNMPIPRMLHSLHPPVSVSVTRPLPDLFAKYKPNNICFQLR